MEREKLIKLQDIEARMKLTPRDYKLYEELGDYYLNENVNKAYLCYEHCLVYCDEEKECIVEKIDSIKEMGDFNVKPSSIVILSYNSKELIEDCINSIRENSYHTEYEIVVVDNASDEDTVNYLKKQENIVLRLNKENVGFPAGCNQGITLANKENDIMLLNNDAIMCINSLFWLRMALYGEDRVGACGSVTNYAINDQIVYIPNDDKDEYERLIEINNCNIINSLEPKRWLVGFAVLLRRKAIDEVGVLDEMFSPGNLEDVDLGVRISKAGYVQYLCHNSYIKHIGSQSFGKDTNKYKGLVDKNMKKFVEKWGLTPEEVVNSVEIVFKGMKLNKKREETHRRIIDEKRYMDFWRLVFNYTIKEHLIEYKKLILSGDKQNIDKVLESIYRQEYVTKYRVSAELTSLIVYLSIYELERTHNIQNHIFSFGDSFEKIEEKFVELKYALWRVCFIADIESYNNFLGLINKYNISDEYIDMLIKTSAMHQLEAYYTIGYLMRSNNRDLLAIKLYTRALEIAPDDELILCEISDIFWKYGKVDVAMNYMSRITNPTKCTEKYLQKWGNK